jgi:hypothetical protein
MTRVTRVMRTRRCRMLRMSSNLFCTYLQHCIRKYSTNHCPVLINTPRVPWKTVREFPSRKSGGLGRHVVAIIFYPF